MLSSLLRQINVLKSADALLAKKNKLLCEKLGAYHSSYAGVTNGGFETGDLTGWIVANEGNGVWSAYSGTLSPVSGLTIADSVNNNDGQFTYTPKLGVYAATSDQTGPGSHIMYQDLVLKKFQSHNLTLILYYDNRAGEFCTPDTLDPKIACNQQYRVDVMDPAAPVDSVASGDVLATLFRTEVGAPPTLAPTPMAYDLSAFAGRTVRLRFSEVDNQNNFLASVDAVNLQSTC